MRPRSRIKKVQVFYIKKRRKIGDFLKFIQILSFAAAETVNFEIGDVSNEFHYRKMKLKNHVTLIFYQKSSKIAEELRLIFLDPAKKS